MDSNVRNQYELLIFLTRVHLTELCTKHTSNPTQFQKKKKIASSLQIKIAIKLGVMKEPK